MTATLRTLAAAIGVDLASDAEVGGIAHDSRRVRPGDLFVALPGTRQDGARFVDDAVARGAVAACVARDAVGRIGRVAVPLLPVAEPRAALARLAAAFHGEPARQVRLIGITGTLGKTSTALLVQAALAASRNGSGIGVIGSLGARVSGAVRERIARDELPHFDGMTTPDAPALHRALRVMADAGIRMAAMEVTSHALAQHRVHGLAFVLGVITNIVPDEHLDYHGTPEHYLATKARFFDHLAPGAPVVFGADDPLVREMVTKSLAREPRPVIGVSFGEYGRALGKDPDDLAARDAAVHAERLRWDASGASFVLSVRRPLPRLSGGELPASEVPIVLPVLGVQQATNVALAATAALVAGAPPDAVTAALAEMPPVRRRMEVVRPEAPFIIDDTAGHPDTLRAVFITTDAFARRALRVLFGLRGSRGVEINERLAETLAELARARARREPVRLVVTCSAEAASERDRVRAEEHTAAITVLKRALAASPVELMVERTLAAGVRRLLDGLAGDELVLLLGAQGMDRAAELVRDELAARGA